MSNDWATKIQLSAAALLAHGSGSRNVDRLMPFQRVVKVSPKPTFFSSQLDH